MIDPRFQMWDEIKARVEEFCYQYHSGLISLPVFLASLDGYRRFGYRPSELAREHAPDPLQPDAEAVRIEASRAWVKSRRTS